MRVDKIKRKATIVMSDGQKLDVSFFLSPFSESHSGGETVFDVVSSQNSFVPLVDNETGEIVFMNKDHLMLIELLERESEPEIDPHPRSAQVQVEMINKEKLNGEVFIDMPQSRSRVSDYFNIFHQFISIHGSHGDLILNKAYIYSVTER